MHFQGSPSSRFRCVGLAAFLLVVGGTQPATAQLLNRDVNASERRDAAEKWKRLLTRFSSATPSTTDLQRFGGLAYDLYLHYGENPDGTLRDPASSSNFYAANFYPRMMAAYCYWKAGQELRDAPQSSDPASNKAAVPGSAAASGDVASHFQKAAQVLEAVRDLDRFDRYQFPCIQAIYIDSAIQTDLGDPDLLMDLTRLQNSLRRVQHRKDGPLTTVRGETVKAADINVMPEVETSGMTFAERGVPLVLAKRIVQAEQTALADIITRLRRTPKLTLDRGPIQAIDQDPIPVISGTVSYPAAGGDSDANASAPRPFPLPLEIEAVDAGGRPAGTVAPNVTNRFRIPLDRLLPGQKERVRVRWTFADRAADVVAFLNLPDPGAANPTDERDVFFNRTTQFPDENRFAYVTDKTKLLTYQTDLNRGAAFQVGQPALPTDSILVTSSNATYVTWWVTSDDPKGATPGGADQKIVQPFLDGKAKLDLTALHLERLPIGDYRFHIQLTAQDAAQANWTEGIYYTADSEDRVAIHSADLKQLPTPGFSIASRSAAFVVGIESYEGAMRLANGANDAQQMFDTLTQNFGYSRANVSLLVGANSVYGEREPGHAELLNTKYVISSEGDRPGSLDASDFRRSFSAFLKRVKALHANHILLFFSGHGTDRGGEDYFLCGSLDSIATAELLRDLITAFGDETATIVGLYDACRDGDDPNSAFGGQPIGAADSHVSYQPILACRRGQTSNDNPPGVDALKDASGNRIANGFFTYSVLQSMQAYLRKPQTTGLPVKELVQGAIPVLAALTKEVGVANQKRSTENSDALMTDKQNIASLDIDNHPVDAENISGNLIAAKQYRPVSETRKRISTSPRHRGK